MMLRDKLRAATRSEHEALERSLALERADLDRDSYITYLRGWLAFCRSIEKDFRAGRELWKFTADCNLRIDWLEDDLSYLAGTSAAAAMPSSGLRCRTIPELAGSSYVIEGAMLGAQVVYRQLNQRWRIQKDKGGTFLWGYGPPTGGHWRQFVAALNGLMLEEGERQRCLLTAKSTFRLLEDAFFMQWRSGGAHR
jgi:heme oxygenase